MIVDKDVYEAYQITEFLEHHGTKGQKWGIRNHSNEKKWNQRSGKQKATIVGAALVGHSVGGLLGAKGSTTIGVAGAIAGGYAGIRAVKKIMDKNGQTPSKHIHVEKSKKQAKLDEHTKKANDLLNTALKDPTTLINLNGRVIVTGHEFVQHLSNGGVLNPSASSVYAQRVNGKGKYVLQ